MKKLLFVIIEQATPNMKSEKNAAYHKICGKELINYVKDTINTITDANAITLSKDINIPDLSDFNTVILIQANAPLITADTIGNAVRKHGNRELTVICANENTPVIIADIDYIKSVVSKFSSPEELFKALLLTNPDKFIVEDENELICVTDRIELSKAERIMQKRIINYHMKNGVTFILPETTVIEDNAEIGEDTVIYPNVYIKSGTRIGKNCSVGSQTQITSSTVGDNVTIQSSVLLECFVDEGTTVGPFAYIRPNTRVGKKVRIGDFVELKNSNIGDDTKISHLTYVGDSDVGERVNFGCGTVTVNYDGKKKYRTTIGDDCFIGCNTNLVAPVTVENGGYTAAGSTITDLVPENALAIARARQVNKTQWKDRRK